MLTAVVRVSLNTNERNQMNDDQMKARKACEELSQMMSGDNLDQTLMQFAILARATKLRYEAFLKAGFTPDQAIQLCK